MNPETTLNTSSTTSERLHSIRTKLILGFGLILLPVALSAFIGILSLSVVQHNTKTTLEEASRIRDLSLQVQGAFLMARESESGFLRSWRTLGYQAAYQRFVLSNQRRLEQARNHLSTIDRFVTQSDDHELQELLALTAKLRPLLNEYEQTFQDSVSLAEERSSINGLEYELYNRLDTLERSVAPLPKAELQTLVLRMRTSHAAYFDTHQQEHVDAMRLALLAFEDRVRASRTADLTDGTTRLSPQELMADARQIYAIFTRLVALSQRLDNNVALFNDLSEHIDRITTQLLGVSNAGLERAHNRLNQISRTSSIALALTGILAISMALTIALFLTGQIMHPLRQLTKAANQIAAGDLNPMVPEGGHDEFAVLARGFNVMSARLRDLIGSLEQRVAERTQRLEQALDENRSLTESLQQELIERTRTAEELVRARDVAEAATRAKSEFLATMSHEIRTPLNAVLGMSSLLLESELNDEQFESVSTVHRSGLTLLSLINDILDFSKIEAGKLTLEQQPFALPSCVEEALDLLAAQAAEKQIDLAYQIDPALPCIFIGDVTRLRQVLVNLIGNGIKFTEHGEVVVTLHGHQTESTASTNGQPIYEIHMMVRDTGIGIPADRLESLFQLFTQIDASTTRKYGGTGLGLAITRQLVGLMGGRIWVESIVGVGSTFHATIQVPTTETQPPLTTNEQQLLRGKRALIVDDSTTGGLIIGTICGSWGMSWLTADSGSKATQLLTQYGLPDVLLIDSHMPETSGLALARTIHARPIGKKLPLVLISFGQRRDIGADAELFAAVLSRPLKPAQLYRAITQALSCPLSPVTRPTLLAPPDQILAMLHPLRILVAEDNPINQRVTLRILERLGYQADLACDGREVLESLADRVYDVILMDIQMPNLDGLGAAKQIRAQADQLPQPWIIALTANAIRGDRERALEAGMDDYLTKPLLIESLRVALERAAIRDHKMM